MTHRKLTQFVSLCLLSLGCQVTNYQHFPCSQFRE